MLDQGTPETKGLLAGSLLTAPLPSLIAFHQRKPGARERVQNALSRYDSQQQTTTPFQAPTRITPSPMKAVAGLSRLPTPAPAAPAPLVDLPGTGPAPAAPADLVNPPGTVPAPSAPLAPPVNSPVTSPAPAARPALGDTPSNAPAVSATTALQHSPSPAARSPPSTAASSGTSVPSQPGSARR